VFLFLGTNNSKYNPVDVNHVRQVCDVKRYLMARWTIGTDEIAICFEAIYSYLSVTLLYYYYYYYYYY